MDLPIRNINDLNSEIARLTDLQQQQKEALHERFNGPSALFSTVLSLFPKSSTVDNIRGNLLHQDYFGLLSRIVLPFALNKTLFRHSNFVIKALVGMLSQKASHFISEDSVSGLWDKAKGLFNKLTSKNKPQKETDLQGYEVPQL